METQGGQFKDLVWLPSCKDNEKAKLMFFVLPQNSLIHSKSQLHRPWLPSEIHSTACVSVWL